MFPLPSQTILCADDDPDDRELICETITRLHPTYRVVHAKDGWEAFTWLQQASTTGSLPCLVILDINMPKMDGVTATRLMTGQYPDVAVVGLSVTEDQYHKAAMERAGALGVLTKGKQGVDELCREIEKAAAMMSFISQARKKTALLN